MRKEITFTIKEKGFRKHLVVSAVVDVPENWDSMSEDDKYEYLVYTPHHNIGQWVLPSSPSVFQKATGAEEVMWFRFASTPPNVRHQEKHGRTRI
jgi:hypothetical protein